MDAYLSLTYEARDIGKCPLFPWDNYLSLYLARFGSSVTLSRWATHCDGDKPKHSPMIEMKPWEIPENMDSWLTPQSKPWIMNVDLD